MVFLSPSRQQLLKLGHDSFFLRLLLLSVIIQAFAAMYPATEIVVQ
jgi:hypothetical protein